MCWQSQCNSIESPLCLQCSLQYFPYSPPFSALQLQAGWAHFSAMEILLARKYLWSEGGARKT